MVAVFGLLSVVMALCRPCTADELFTVTLGRPQREYAPERVNAPCGVAIPEPVRSNNYTGVRETLSEHRLYRVNIPITITCHAARTPKMATLCYAFSYDVRRDDTIRAPAAMTNFPLGKLRIIDVPLRPGATTWTVTSDWLLEMDPSIWRPRDRYIEESNRGRTRVRQQQTRSARSSRALSSFIFPYRLTAWVPQRGLDGAWYEATYPHVMVRSVEGTESVNGIAVYAFTDNANLNGAGTLNLEGLRKLAEHCVATADSPYQRTFAYTNQWMLRPWAGTVMRTSDHALRAAMLARILRETPDDSDAADLLLHELVQLGDAERAFRVYQECAARFPALQEYWFELYYNALSNPAAKRAALTAVRREYPHCAFALEKLTEESMAGELWGLARRLCNEWQAREPGNPRIFLYQATIATAERRDDDARRALTTALVLTAPMDTAVTGMYRRGSAAYLEYLRGCVASTNHFADARMYFRRALRLDDSYFPAAVELARLYMTNVVAYAAQEYVTRALRAAPEHPATLSLAGQMPGARVGGGAIERLRGQLLPRAQQALLRGDWTNAADLTRCLLDADPAHIETRLLHARALQHLQLYDEASRTLYDISARGQTDARVVAAWADLCHAIDNDLSVIVISEQPIDWEQRQLELWQRARAGAAREPRSLLELAILHLRRNDVDSAFLALRDLFKHAPSPELAQWLGDVCMRKAREHVYLTIPSIPGRSYLREAQDWYRGTGANRGANPTAINELGTPGAYRGLWEAARLSSDKTVDPLVFLRAGLRRYPAAGELRSDLIRSAAEHGALAPLLWVPYTNAIQRQLPLHPDVVESMIAVATALRDNAALAAAYELKAALIARWDALLNSNITSRREYTAPALVFAFERDNRTSFVLRRLAYMTPYQANDWYAIRSRYTMSDLLNGRTRWWRRREFVLQGYDALFEARRLGMAISNAAPGAVNAGSLYGSLMGQLELTRVYPPSEAYGYELQRCFDRPRTRVTGQVRTLPARGAVGAQTPPALPAVIPGGDWVPAAAGTAFVPPRVLFDLLRQTDMPRALPWFDGVARHVSSRAMLRMPSHDTMLQLTGFAAQHNIAVTGYVDAASMCIEQAAPVGLLDTNLWPMLAASDCKQSLTLLPSMFMSALSGGVSGLTVRATSYDELNPYRLLLVLTPAPLEDGWRTAAQEALVFDWLWTSLTTMSVRVFCRTFGDADGMPLDRVGLLLGELPATAPATLTWRLDQRNVSVALADGQHYSVAHALSAYAWPRGLFASFALIPNRAEHVFAFDELTLVGQ
jgi:hypothetical protein